MKNNLTKKDIIATVIWFAFMYIVNAFIWPLIGWSDDPIGWFPILIKLVIWLAACILTLLWKNRKAKTLTGNEKMR